MRGRDFLQLAAQLAGEGTEAAWRSGVSRAYYAAFHVASDLLRRGGFDVPRGEQAHGYLWLRLNKCGQPDVEKAGADLKSLRHHRNWSDYDLHRTYSEGTAALQVVIAEDVVRILEAASEEPFLSRIVEGMRVYERDVLRENTWDPKRS